MRNIHRSRENGRVRVGGGGGGRGMYTAGGERGMTKSNRYPIIFLPSCFCDGLRIGVVWWGQAGR